MNYMGYEKLLVEVRDYIGIITFNQPQKLNTFTSDLAREFNHALLEMEEDLQVRVIVFRGAGKAFTAGIDMRELKGKNPYELSKWIELMHETSKIISTIGKPVIASVHNIAMANGIGLVAAADLCIAAEETKFGATAVNLGLFCMGPAVPLSKCLGRKKALELLLTGDIILADEALRIGLINKVVPKENLEEETLIIAKKLAAKSPLALQLGKKSFYKMSDLEYLKALEATTNHFAILCSTDDATEGVDAFLNKRKPEWQHK